jgi:hypothetical protein
LKGQLEHQLNSEEIVEDIKPSTLSAGWTVDNTRANMGALQQLEADHPEWINVGCIAHGLALAMKDFCSYKKTPGRFSTRWGISWLADVTDRVNVAANYFSRLQPCKKCTPPASERVVWENQSYGC